MSNWVPMICHTKYLSKRAALTGKGKAKTSLEETHQTHKQTPFRRSPTLFFGKTCERLKNFTFISHTYLDVFLDSCGVFYKWSTGRFGQHADIVLKTVLLFSSVKCSMTRAARVHVPVQPVFLPHKEQNTSPWHCCQAARQEFSWQKYKFLTLQPQQCVKNTLAGHSCV